MLLNLWTLFGSISLGLWVGFGWAVLVMNQWYLLVDRREWDGTSAPDWLFITFLLAATVPGFLFGRATFRWSRNRIEFYDAEILKKRWITRRRDREMTNAMKGR